MPGPMRICIAIPSIDFEDIIDNEILKSFILEDPVPFSDPSVCNLDVFSKELAGLAPPKLWGINIPNFPLEANKAIGVAGPGKPSEEVFVPTELKRKLTPLIGKYDKWRPYPAEKPLSDYAMKMAKRFCNKRCKIFNKAACDYSWDTLFYVETAPLSLAHLNKEFAMELCDQILKVARTIHKEWPDVPIVIFSPFGVDCTPGFTISTNVPSSACINNWENIRRYLNGEDL